MSSRPTLEFAQFWIEPITRCKIDEVFQRELCRERVHHEGKLQWIGVVGYFDQTRRLRVEVATPTAALERQQDAFADLLFRNLLADRDYTTDALDAGHLGKRYAQLVAAGDIAHHDRLALDVIEVARVYRRCFQCDRYFAGRRWHRFGVDQSQDLLGIAELFLS